MVSVADERLRGWTALMTSDRLACKAFSAVFQRRQTRHHALLAWLRGRLAAARPSSCAERCMLEDASAWRAGRTPAACRGNESTQS